jgi:hypothetical protein
MFDLIEQPVNEPELTMREKAAIEEVQRWKEKKIEEAVAIRMLDPEYIIDAILICLGDYLHTQKHMEDLLMGHGDESIHIANIRLDVRDWITHQVTKEAERGVL